MDDRTTLTQQIGMQLAELQNAADAFDQAAARVLGINANDLQCLALISIRGPMSAGELAEAAGLTPGAITMLVDRLERAGYARRTRDTVDRRRVAVEATPHAMELTGSIWGPLAEEGRQALSKYSDADLRAIASFLRDARAIQERHALRIRALVVDDPDGAAAGS